MNKCYCGHPVESHMIVKEYVVSCSVHEHHSGYKTIHGGSGCRHCVCVSFYVNNEEEKSDA